MQGPLILFSEFETALVELKTKKAEGPDGRPGELIVIRINGKTRIICNMQSNVRLVTWPNEFMESVIIPLLKRRVVHKSV